MLLNDLPHECTIRRKTFKKGSMGRGKPSFTEEQTGVACWDQPASSSPSVKFQKKGMEITHEVFFVADPGISPRHQIVITKRDGVAVVEASQVPLDVASGNETSAGLSALWSVMCGRITSSEE